MSDASVFIRLKGAVEAASRAVPEDQLALADEALGHSYRTLREQVRRLVPEDLQAEFDGLFPERLPQVVSRSMGRLGLQASRAHQARTLLETMAGWLGGVATSLQEDERLRVEADAYARERVRVERGVDARDMGEAP